MAITDNLGPLPQLHPRLAITNKAEIELNSMIWAWMETHDLTYLEAVRALLHETHQLTRFMLRRERHPHSKNKKADEK